MKEVVIENYQNGAKYEGEKLKGMRHGKGRFFYSDGGVYDGEWKENRMYGKGILYYGCGKIAVRHMQELTFPVISAGSCCAPRLRERESRNSMMVQRGCERT